MAEVELALLRERFPEAGVYECGTLRSGELGKPEMCKRGSGMNSPPPPSFPLFISRALPLSLSLFSPSISPSLLFSLTFSIDFFCARTSDGCSYEGRLFVMDRALLFVST